MAQPRPADGVLSNWPDLQRAENFAGLLVGNGSSRAVWKDFAYTSLLERARGANIEHPLPPEAQGRFEQLETADFETVLTSHRDAERGSAAIGPDAARIKETSAGIRSALIEAVQNVHVPRPSVPDTVLERMQEALLEYEFVFSTNYDLLIPWAVMSNDRQTEFRDYFWGRCRQGNWVCFHDDDTDAGEGVTKILYLHGALHLYELASGEAAKATADATSLLDLLSVPGEDDELDVPLFITEVAPQDKLRAIRRSDYLSFAFREFSSYEDPVVVFGHSLGPGDEHVLNVMRGWGDQAIAISILPGRESDVVERKLELMRLLPEADLAFFDATTHPLGSPELRVPGGA